MTEHPPTSPMINPIKFLSIGISGETEGKNLEPKTSTQSQGTWDVACNEIADKLAK